MKKLSNEERIKAANKAIPSLLLFAVVGFVISFFILWLGVTITTIFVIIAIVMEYKKYQLRKK